MNVFKAHWLYLLYVLRHKWFVFQAGLKYKVPIWNLIIHDWTKFLPIEWFPYVNNFFLNPPKREKQPKGHFQTPTGTPFDYAWLHHQNHWPHHWQYWILTYDNEIEKIKVLKMPEVYVREMCADWTGAGLAQGKPDILGWYEENKQKILIHPETRELVERLLNE